MDFLSKKHEFSFLNNKKDIVRVHVIKIASSKYDIWTEGKSKKYRDSVRLIEPALKNFNKKDLPPIVIVSNNKMGEGGISSYNHNDDIIYFNSYFHTYERINEVLEKQIFAAKDLSEIIHHELGHKKHWDAIKKFYKANKSKYNNLNEAKKILDSQLESYINKQSLLYLRFTVSPYAQISYSFAKKHNSLNIVNEVIAEVIALNGSTDLFLNNLIESELNYGKD